MAFLPALIAVSGLGGTLSLSRFLVSQERSYWLRRTESEVRHVAAQLEDGINQKFDSLQRTGEWWLALPKPVTTDEWLSNASLVFQGDDGLEKLIWIDPTGAQVWSAEPGAPPQAAAEATPSELLELTRLAQAQDSAALSAVTVGPDGHRHVYACKIVRNRGRLAGFIIGWYDARRLVASVLKAELPADYSVSVLAGKDPIYSLRGTAAADAAIDSRSSAVVIANQTWNLELSAAVEEIGHLRILVMSFGLMVTVLLYVGAAVARTSRDRAIALEEVNAALHAEVRVRKRAEEKVAELNRDLQRRLSEFETLLDVLPVGIAVADDPECKNIWTNPALARMMGVPVGINISKSAPYADQLAFRLQRNGIDVPPEELPMQIAARTGRDVSAEELDIVRPDGALLHTLSYSAPLFDENGKVRGVLDACVDISERKRLLDSEQRSRQEAERALAALHASESNFRRLIDSDVIGVVAIEDYTIVDANAYFARLIGIPRDELRNGSVRWQEITPEEHRTEDDRRLATLLEDRKIEPEQRELIRRDGARVPVLLGAALLEGASPWRSICFVVDQTTRRDLEARLRRAEKVNSLARMAGGIAHDFNNLLTGILGNASLASDFLPPDDRLHPILNEIIKASSRAAELVAQILAFTGRAQRSPELLNLSELVRDAAPELSRTAGRTAEVSLDLAADLPSVRADRDQLGRVLSNLTANAIEALPEAGGRISIRTSDCDLSQNEAAEGFPDQDLKPGRYVRLEVRDNGHGIPEHVAAQMFDPFFTTKFVGRGLGLSAVQGVVRAHNGGIRVTSSADAGTRFEVVLPAAASPAEE